MKLRNVTIAAAALAVVLPSVATAADKITIKYLTAWDKRVQGTPKIAYKFGEMVNKATNGRIEFKFSGPEVISVCFVIVIKDNGIPGIFIQDGLQVVTDTVAGNVDAQIVG